MITAEPTDPKFNCYVSYDEASVFIGNMLYATNWKNANDTEQQRSLLTATQILETYVDWYGEVTQPTQLMRWPQKDVQIEGRPSGTYFDKYTVPEPIKRATVELAESLLGEDLTEDQETGLSGLRVGPIALQFNRKDRKDEIPDSVARLIKFYGRVLKSSGGTVPIVRT